MLASNFLDMVMGVDIHFELVPPTMAPTPIPNPFVGMVWDPGGLLVGQAMSLAMALLTGVPPKGPVLINSMPATTCGTNAKNSLGVPHILLPPGVQWAPMPKLPKPAIKGPPPPPGPPVAPEGDAICVFGSKTVQIMGSSSVRMGDLVMSCGEPVRLPSSMVLCIPKGAPVMVGGPPALSISDAIGALLKSKWIAGYLHDLLSRMAPGRLRNLLTMAVCFLTGHPVDVATGRVLTSHVDWELPGPMPLAFERNYASSWANRDSPLGHGWSHSLDQAVWAERGKLVYLDGDGRELEFDTFDFPDHVLPVGPRLFEPISRLTLTALGRGRFEIATPQGVIHEFAPVPGASGARAQWSRLIRKRARDGATIELLYDARANLEWVRDSAGRQIGFDHDRAGRLTAVKLPHPTQAGWQVHTRYVHDQAGDLTSVIDPLGYTWRFAYQQHLLMQETNRNGLSFYFAYDGYGEDAYCVRTWGDGGLYDHVIAYDKAGKTTVVTNSLGHTTTYKMNVAGCVVEVIDPVGASTKYQYDERTLHKIKETDPAGGETTWVHDAQGNVIQIVQPGGAVVDIGHDDQNLPVRATDAMKGDWRWSYDAKGRLVGRADPLGRKVQFQWAGSRVAGMTDPAGQQTILGHDEQSNLTLLRTPDGAERRWSHDLLGRCVRAVNANGAVETRELDPVGRIVRVCEADGNVRELVYDPEGNVLRVRDQHHDVRYTYQGIGRVTSRSEAGTTVRFEYDSEEQLVAIANEHGRVYAFELGPTGQVTVERGFDELRRRFERDEAGRVKKVFRPDDRLSEYSYDEAGRVTAIAYSDGSAAGFVYRADGELAEARNASGSLVFERDVLGRILREKAGDDWVASEFDALGARVRVTSSKGLQQRIRRDGSSRAVELKATVQEPEGRGAPPARVWAAEIKRDALGQEIERALPGGLRSRWERDRIGRPIKQEVSVGREFRRAVQYTWDVDNRLRMVVDALRGPVRYEHDPVGHLVAAIYQDGQGDLRMPDAVGNLFRTQSRGDRKYGAAGELLEARDPDGSVVRYRYDGEGNLVRKSRSPAWSGEDVEDVKDVDVWTYAWNGDGTLGRVVRPDGDEVLFTYDALGRRLSKTYRGRTTRWIWDGNVPLHEWVEAAEATGDDTAPRDGASIDEIAARRLEAVLAGRPAQGPPRAVGTASAPITWLFDPESFAPAAKLVGDNHCSILTDHLGTPVSMVDADGVEVWAATTDVYGDLRDVAGDRHACPFRWPGQYEDAETGLSYNRFRYYDPAAGSYISQDPIGLAGGSRLLGYVGDPTRLIDPFGLNPCTKDKPHVFWSANGNPEVFNEAEAFARQNGGVILEMTGKGSALAKSSKSLDWLEAKPAWAKLSKLFAKEASGDVHVFVNAATGAAPTSVWNTVERPILEAAQKAGKVGNIIVHAI